MNTNFPDFLWGFINKFYSSRFSRVCLNPGRWREKLSKILISLYLFMSPALFEKLYNFILVAFNRVSVKTGNSESVFWRFEISSFDDSPSLLMLYLMVWREHNNYNFIINVITKRFVKEKKMNFIIFMYCFGWKLLIICAGMFKKYNWIPVNLDRHKQTWM